MLKFYVLGNQAKKNYLQNKIKNFLIPNDITRIDFDLNRYANWKASEYRTFYHHIALPLFRNELPSPNYWNLLCLIYGKKTFNVLLFQKFSLRILFLI